MATFGDVRCPLCKHPLKTITTIAGIGAGGDTFCSSCDQRVSYWWSASDAGTLHVKMLTLPSGRPDPGEITYRG